MSYDIALCKNGEPVTVESHTEGGTYAIGGTDKADMSVTYNYTRHFPFRRLHGEIAADTIPVLTEAVRRLGTERDVSYWAPTEGNAGHACSVLLRWAQEHSDAVWEVV